MGDVVGRSVGRADGRSVGRSVGRADGSNFDQVFIGDRCEYLGNNKLPGAGVSPMGQRKTQPRADDLSS